MSGSIEVRLKKGLTSQMHLSQIKSQITRQKYRAIMRICCVAVTPTTALTRVARYPYTCLSGDVWLANGAVHRACGLVLRYYTLSYLELLHALNMREPRTKRYNTLSRAQENTPSITF